MRIESDIIQKREKIDKELLKISDRFPHSNVVNGVLSYLSQKNLISFVNMEEKDISSLVSFFERIGQITNGSDFYKSNAFKYIY